MKKPSSGSDTFIYPLRDPTADQGVLKADHIEHNSKLIRAQKPNRAPAKPYKIKPLLKRVN